MNPTNGIVIFAIIYNYIIHTHCFLLFGMQISLLKVDFYAVTIDLHDSQGEKSIFNVIADLGFIIIGC